jgi:putative PEP-CTERM system histidine kinase
VPLEGLTFHPAAWSYGIACALFAAFALRLSLAWRGGWRAALLLSAIVLSAVWAGLSLAAMFQGRSPAWWDLARVIDACRLGAWLGFLALLLQSGQGVRAWARIPGAMVAVGLALLGASAFLPMPAPWIASDTGPRPALALAAGLGVAILGLALAEQLYRRTSDGRRWAVKPLVLALAAVFGFDLVYYSDAVLFKSLDMHWWAARGIVHAMAIPLVAVATARNTSWTLDLHVSRGVVFHSTALLAIGGYLLLLAAAGYWVRFFGGSWGSTLQIVLVSLGLIALAVLALSESLRARLRVFVSKNFFSYRYDYRQQWLRFTQALGTPIPGQSIHSQVVQALADLVESRGGTLWIEREGEFHEESRGSLRAVGRPEPASGSLAEFMARTGWVVNVQEAKTSPQRYAGLVLPDWLAGEPDAWLVVPLVSEATLVGFVVLSQPRAPITVDWEVLDLLKTASRQAASYLAQFRANAALMEAQKFEAFNRMSAFVVHDLKNLVAQLTLMMRNADRHFENPEFRADMVETVRHVSDRMSQLMMQLRSGTVPVEKPAPVELAAIGKRISMLKAGRSAAMSVEIDPAVRVLGHADRLERVLGHLVQNALEAAQDGGRVGGQVSIRAFVEGRDAVIEVADDGVGMTAEFIRERLFHPFQTTKQQGMGIGLYESAQYVRSLGGRIAVESEPGVGTRIRVHLPAAPVVELLRDVA